MEKVLIVCVNYNSYEELKNYLLSINNSASATQGRNQVDVIVADNSIKKQNLELNCFSHISVKLIRLENSGYLGGAQRIINDVENIYQYDYVAISNVDIELSSNFFENLLKYQLDKDIAWIATRIWSKAEERDRNPKIISRPSKRRLQIVNLMYRFPILDYLYTKTLYKRKAMYMPSPEMDIFAGHGSFMMLTRHFFEHYKKIEYPIFLFGEEIYLGELIRLSGMRVRYVPSLEVIDMEHASTGKMKKAFYYKCNNESIEYILDHFYNE